MTAPHRYARPGHGLRALRAAVFAAVCVVLAAAGHALASLDAVPLWTLGAGFLGAAALAAPFAGRPRPLAGIVAMLAAGQTALHTLFGLGQHTAAGSASATHAVTSVSDATLVHHAAHLVCGTTAAAISPAEAHRILTDAGVHPGLTGRALPAHHTADAVSAATGSPAALLPSLSMLLGHVLAAVVAGWLLRRGDLALLRSLEMPALAARAVAEGAVVRSLRGALALARALYAGLPGAAPAGALPPGAQTVPAEPHSTALEHTVVRRGPPAGPFALAA